MKFSVTPEFRAACRHVLGDGSPAIVLPAIISRDPRINDVYALAARDPARWFCSAIDENEIPRLWAKADSETEAKNRAELAVTEMRERKQAYREMAPRSEWTFVTYPPDEGGLERADGQEQGQC